MSPNRELELQLVALGEPDGAAPRTSASALLAAAAVTAAASAPKAASAGVPTLLAWKLAAALLLATSVVVGVDLAPSRVGPEVGQTWMGVAEPGGAHRRFGVDPLDAPPVLRVVAPTDNLEQVRPVRVPLAPAPLVMPPLDSVILAMAPRGARLDLESPTSPDLPRSPGRLLPELPEPDELLARSDVSRLEAPDPVASRTRLRLAAQGAAWRADSPSRVGPGLSLGIHHEGAATGINSPYVGATLDTAIVPPPAGHRGAAPQVDVGAAARAGAAVRWRRAGLDLGWTGGVRVMPPVPWLDRDHVAVLPVTGPEVGVVLGSSDKGRFFASLQLQGGLMADADDRVRFVPRAAISLGADLPASRRL
jgi:hypothetical protein